MNLTLDKVLPYLMVQGSLIVLCLFLIFSISIRLFFHFDFNKCLFFCQLKNVIHNTQFNNNSHKNDIDTIMSFRFESLAVRLLIPSYSNNDTMTKYVLDAVVLNVLILYVLCIIWRNNHNCDNMSIFRVNDCQHDTFAATDDTCTYD